MLRFFAMLFSGLFIFLPIFLLKKENIATLKGANRHESVRKRLRIAFPRACIQGILPRADGGFNRRLHIRYSKLYASGKNEPAGELLNGGGGYTYLQTRANNSYKKGNQKSLIKNTHCKNCPFGERCLKNKKRYAIIINA